MNLWSGECTEPSLVWNQLLSQTVLKHVVSRDFIPMNSVQGTSTVSWRNLCHCWISDLVATNLLEYVTRPAKIGHICTQNLALFLNFNLQYLLMYESYDNNIFMPYLQINKKTENLQNINIISINQEKYHFLSMCNLCRYARFSQAQSHMLTHYGIPRCYSYYS